MRYKIDVLKTDIKKGKRREPRSCPVARAVCRTLRSQLKNFEGVSVYGGPSGIALNTTDDVSETIDAPIRASRFISKFDKGKPVKPFSFYLTINN
jgi:hypothetical protein